MGGCGCPRVPSDWLDRGMGACGHQDHQELRCSQAGSSLLAEAPVCHETTAWRSPCDPAAGFTCEHSGARWCVVDVHHHSVSCCHSAPCSTLSTPNGTVQSCSSLHAAVCLSAASCLHIHCPAWHCYSACRMMSHPVYMDPGMSKAALTHHVPACRYEEGYDLDETLAWMKEKWSEEKGSAREEGHARWLLALKSATRQALQVWLGLSTFTLSTWCHAGVHVCCNCHVPATVPILTASWWSQPPSLQARCSTSAMRTYHLISHRTAVCYTHHVLTWLVMQGLELIHSCGLVHGDIKVDNIRASLPPNGTQLRVAILDLGGSCAAGSGGNQLFAKADSVTVFLIRSLVQTSSLDGSAHVCSDCVCTIAHGPVSLTAGSGVARHGGLFVALLADTVCKHAVMSYMGYNTTDV